MKVILLKDVLKLGRKYDVRDVSDGHGRNFLIKRGLAEVATAKSLKMVEDYKKSSVAARQAEESETEALFARISKVKLILKEKSNDEGILFAGIKPEILSKALRDQAGLNIPIEYIKLDKPIKSVGEHQIEVGVSSGGKKAKFKLVIERE